MSAKSISKRSPLRLHRTLPHEFYEVWVKMEMFGNGYKSLMYNDN